MPVFTSKEGKLIISRPHKASFHGIHNASKSKVLIVLYWLKNTVGDNTGLSVKELAEKSGCNYDYLKTRLGKWHDWRYVSRRAVGQVVGRPIYKYSIAQRGEHFIEDIIPKDILSRYIDEIKSHSNENTY